MDNPMQFMLFATLVGMCGGAVWYSLAPERIAKYGYTVFAASVLVFLAWAMLVVFILIAWEVTNA